MASFGELPPNAFRSWLPTHTLEEVTPSWDDDTGTYALFSGRHPITTQCISDPDIMSRDLVRDYHARARVRRRGRVRLLSVGGRLRWLATSYNEFIKSNQERMQTPEFRKRMKALAAPDRSHVLSMFAHNPKSTASTRTRGRCTEMANQRPTVQHAIASVIFGFCA